MFSPATFRNASRTIRLRRYYSAVAPEDVGRARAHCVQLVKRFDVPSYTLHTFIQPSARDAYIAIRAFNIDIARVADSISNEAVGKLRMQFWRDVIEKTFRGQPPKEPVSILLWSVLQDLEQRGITLSKNRFLRVITAREKYMTNAPYPSLSALESYAESTYSNLLYLTLSSLGLASVNCDHLASHIGKASGIATVLRGLPLIAFPPPPNKHSVPNSLGSMKSAMGDTGGGAWTAAVPLPLDIMAESGVKEEEVFRQGANAPGLKDAVFKIATLANDHLITARQILKNLKAGENAGHEFEHQAENEVDTLYEEGDSLKEINRAFGVFMPAVATQVWLDKLEKLDFDVFSPKLRQHDWKLPWKAYWAFRGKYL